MLCLAIKCCWPYLAMMVGATSLASWHLLRRISSPLAFHNFCFMFGGRSVASLAHEIMSWDGIKESSGGTSLPNKAPIFAGVSWSIFGQVEHPISETPIAWFLIMIAIQRSLLAHPHSLLSTTLAHFRWKHTAFIVAKQNCLCACGKTIHLLNKAQFWSQNTVQQERIWKEASLVICKSWSTWCQCPWGTRWWHCDKINSPSWYALPPALAFYIRM